MKITQIRHELIADFDELPTQYSTNVEIDFERDKVYSEYVISAFYGLIVNGNCEQFSLLPVNNEKIVLPQKAFLKSGYLAISFVFYKDGVVERTNQKTFRIRSNIGTNDILPEDDKVWQDVVISVMNQYIDLKITPQIQKLINDAKELNDKTIVLQETIAEKIGEFDKLAVELRNQINTLIGEHLNNKTNPHKVSLEQVDPNARTVRYEDNIIVDYNGVSDDEIKILNVKGIKHRTNTTSGWKTDNPILLNGEIGIDTDLKRNKIGNGTSGWEELDWFGGSVETFQLQTLFPSVGISNTIYIDLSSKKMFVWVESTKEYRELSPNNTSKWHDATCQSNSNYTVTINDFITVKNSLLAITFGAAIDKTKVVSLKINDELAYQVFSENSGMFGEELENKSAILRFDGSKWLVQTSQSGTIQSSDKSVKDIVTVTRDELSNLQSNGQLVEGTLYQTVEPAEELNINKDAFMSLTLNKDNITIAAANQYLPLALSLKNHQGDCFSCVDGGIKVGKGITKISISGAIRFSSIAKNGGKYVAINKNSTQVAISGAITATALTLNITECVIDVTEGDVIKLYYCGEIGDVIYSSNTYMTFLTIKAIAKDYTLGDIRALVKEITELKDYIADNKIESGDGYIKYPDGTLICYGKVVAAPGVLFAPVRYLKEFITIPSIVVSSVYYNEKESMSVVKEESVTGCNIYITDLIKGVTMQRGAMWQAIGRWK